MNNKLKEKLKIEYRNDTIKQTNGIPVFLNDKFLSGDNQKYMKMYDWMSNGYDLVENIVGKLKYGNTINKMRSETISKLEWRDNSSVLYVSIGTGKNLQFIPETVNQKTLDITGADISMGMLKKCNKKFGRTLNLSLINCCAEDLPFNDNEFDIVFHVGGINFFNDKALAIKEMIRVAKKGTKILIADETADFIENQYKKSKLSKKYFQDKTFDFKEITSNISECVKDLETTLLWDEKFYCITFKT
jgi:ubiquinone/menaquinone biosynthesis C-methylase UbiE